MIGLAALALAASQLEFERPFGAPLPHRAAISQAVDLPSGTLTIDRAGGALVLNRDGAVIGEFEFGSDLRDLVLTEDSVVALTQDGRLVEHRLPSGAAVAETPCDGHALAIAEGRSWIAVAGGQSESLRWFESVGAEPSHAVPLPFLAPVDLSFSPGSNQLAGLFLDREKALLRPRAQERPMSLLLAFDPTAEAPLELGQSKAERWTAGPEYDAEACEFLIGTAAGEVLGFSLSAPGLAPRTRAELKEELTWLKTTSQGFFWAAGGRRVFQVSAEGEIQGSTPLGAGVALRGVRDVPDPGPFSEGEPLPLLVSRGRKISEARPSVSIDPFIGHAAPISAISILKGQVLTASLDGQVIEWTLEPESPLWISEPTAQHEGWVNGVAWRHREFSWVSGGRDGRLLFEPSPSEERRVLAAFDAPITGLASGPSGFAAATAKGELHAYDPAGTELFKADAGRGLVFHVAWTESPDPRVISAGSELRLFEASSGEWLGTVDEFGAPVTSLHASQAHVAVGLANRAVHLFRLGEASAIELERTLGPANTRVEAIAVSPDGSRVAYGDGQEVCLVDWATGKELGRAKPELAITSVTCLAFSDDGQSLWAGYQDGELLFLPLDL